jgi:hypothetical protein
MAETAAHLTDHAFPRLPVRQWVLSVPKRLRYFLQGDTALQGAVLRILLRWVERCLREHSPGCNTKARIGAVAFIHRFGSSLNAHVHFHYCIVDGLFQPAANIGDTADAADAADEVAVVDFHATTGLDAVAIAKVQAQVRQRILRAFVRCGLIGKGDREEMMGWEHGGGFSLDALVCIGGTDRAGLERLLRYCARPPFALEHLHPLDAEHLIYHNPKPRSDSPRDLVLTPLELIDKIVALVPPPRAHRHRYYGVLAPNSPMRAAVTALAPMPVIVPLAVTAANSEETPPHRAASHYLWAMLLARVYAGRSAAGLPDLSGTDEDHRLHCRCLYRAEDTGSPRRFGAAAENCPGARATTAAESSTAVKRDPQWDSSAHPVAVRVRSAHRLVKRHFFHLG